MQDLNRIVFFSQDWLVCQESIPELNDVYQLSVQGHSAELILVLDPSDCNPGSSSLRCTRFAQAISFYLESRGIPASEPEQSLLERIDFDSRLHVSKPQLRDSSTESLGVKQVFDRDGKLVLDQIIEELRREDYYHDQIVHVESTPSVPARFASEESVSVLESSLDPRLLNGIKKELGIECRDFFRHQSLAISRLIQRKHVCVFTSTSSGKSLIYNSICINNLIQDQESRALYIFPTKALAQDQLRSLKQLLAACQLDSSQKTCSTFDGDLAQDSRAFVESQTKVILTNPDMLHINLLPNHACPSLKDLWRNLKLIVVDETHVYKGIFGAHVGNVLKRMLRIILKHRSELPCLVFLSATVGNPREFISHLIGDHVRLEYIDEKEDGSSKGSRTFLLWNPPVLTQNNQKTRRSKLVEKRASPLVESARVAVSLIRRQVRTIVFCKIRKVCELIYSLICELCDQIDRDLKKTVLSYRGGYRADVRREIESSLFNGRTLCVIATNALELGVGMAISEDLHLTRLDIGSLDASIHVGFPGSISSLKQQAGRCGRSSRPSLSILVLYDSPLEHFFRMDPSALFQRPVEKAIAQPFNSKVLFWHVLCACFESPLEEDDAFFPESLCGSVLDALALKGWIFKKLVNSKACYSILPGGFQPEPNSSFNTISRLPALSVNIRETEEKEYQVFLWNSEQVIDRVSNDRAFFELYPGAVLLHRSSSYIVQSLDTEARKAIVMPKSVSFYTKCQDVTDIHVLSVFGSREFGLPGCLIQVGNVKTVTRVYGYRKFSKKTHQVLDRYDLTFPEIVLETEAVWMNLSFSIKERMESLNLCLMSAIHGASHLVSSLTPLFVLCDESCDLDTECQSPLEERQKPFRILIFDRKSGGVGICRELFFKFEDCLRTAHDALSRCSCESGCPSCIHRFSCHEFNAALDKKATKFLLHAILSGSLLCEL